MQQRLPSRPELTLLSSQLEDDINASSGPTSRARSLLRPTESGFWQMIRFALVGGVATVADVAVYWAMIALVHMWYPVAIAIAYAVGIIVSYVLSIVSVFSHRPVADKRLEFAIFAGIGIIAWVLTEAVVIFCVEHLHMGRMVAKFIAIGVVFPFNFGARKLTIFRKTDDQQA
jgi:putative flippase GtrA